MAIVVTCNCGKQFRTKDEHAGRKARCPECGGLVSIPALERAASTEPPSSAPTPSPLPSHPPPPSASRSETGAVQPAFVVPCPLIYKEYGIPYSQRNRSMAQQEGLRYFHGRWVGVAEHSVLRKEQAIISGITFMWILSVVHLSCTALLGLLALLVSTPLPGTVAGHIVAWLLLYLILSGGVTVLWYLTMQWNQVCRWILVGILSLGVLGGFVMAAEGASSDILPGLYLVTALVGIVINILIIWMLACPTASKLFTYNQTH